MPNSQIDKIIGTRIKIARTKKGIGQRKLAKMINVSQSFISRVESGNRSVSAQLFCAIAMSLEIDVNALNPYLSLEDVWTSPTLPWLQIKAPN